MEANNDLKLVKNGDLTEQPYLDHSAIVNELIMVGGAEYVAKIIDKLYVDHNEIAYRLINHSRDGREAVAKHIGKFHGVNHTEIIYKLMENVDDGRWFVGKYLHNFDGVNYGEIAYKLIELGWGLVVAKYLHNFHGLDHNETVHRLIRSGSGCFAIEFRDSFQGLNDDTRLRLYGCLN